MVTEREPSATASAQSPWWQTGLVYEIYVRSFADANGDGVGDLRGIQAHLAYCEWLGVDAIWISPFFPSPMADFGYDVADYTNVDPLFGDLADFEALVTEAHARNLKVLLDFVPNHTSDQHPWFTESRASRTSAKRDWYIWRDPGPGGGPPNNWLSNFGGSGWTLDPASGQYYFHSFLRQQPDLNWRNPEVEAAMHAAMRFWLDRGVDGFRVDAISHLVKDAEFRDDPPNPDYTPDQDPYKMQLHIHSSERPETHDCVARMRKTLDSYEDRVMIGEAYVPLAGMLRYYGTSAREFHFLFNFQLITLRWNAEILGEAIAKYDASIPVAGWPNWVLGNHDRSRVASRVGDDQARVAAMLLLTLRGTPTLYYGDELGMRDVPVPPALVQDPWEKNVPGRGLGRDPERTPMPWTPEVHAGFSKPDQHPWLPLGDDARTRNVAIQTDDPRSPLTLYRRLIQLRRDEDALRVGTYTPALGAPPETLAYVRQYEGDGRRLLVFLNLGKKPREFALPPPHARGRILLATGLDREGEEFTTARVRAGEGFVAELES